LFILRVEVFGGKEKAFLLVEENVTDAAFGDGNEGGGSDGSSDSGSECVGISAFSEEEFGTL
jgi:hypothetical protein